MADFANLSDLDPAMVQLLGTITEWPFAVAGAPVFSTGISVPLSGVSTMSIFRCTLIFESGKYGWSESYYRSATSANDAFANANTLAQQRLSLCGDGVQIPFSRVSDTEQFRDFGIDALNLSTPSVAVPEVKTGIDARADKPYSAILMSIQGPGLYGPYRGRIFLRGIPDDQILGDDPLSTTPAYDALFAAFRMYLIGSGWLMKMQARFPGDFTGGPVTLLGTGPPVIVTTTSTAGLANFDSVVVRGAKGLDPSEPFRGPYEVSSVDATHFTIQGLALLGAYTGGATWRKVKTVYIPIAGGHMVREVSHRTGPPFSSPVGRRKRR